MPTEKNLQNLVINQIDSQATYDAMKSKGLINNDELYLITGEEKAITEMIGATDSANGASGLVPTPLKGDASKVLFGDGTWHQYLYICPFNSNVLNDVPDLSAIADDGDTFWYIPERMILQDTVTDQYYYFDPYAGPNHSHHCWSRIDGNIKKTYEIMMEGAGMIGNCFYREGIFSPPSPAAATVGDMLRVKTVDTYGNITEMETAPTTVVTFCTWEADD